jgi:signal transduction histidine kinase/ActR/RegA family two-component response regulator
MQTAFVLGFPSNPRHLGAAMILTSIMSRHVYLTAVLLWGVAAAFRFSLPSPSGVGLSPYYPAAAVAAAGGGLGPTAVVALLALLVEWVARGPLDATGTVPSIAFAVTALSVGVLAEVARRRRQENEAQRASAEQARRYAQKLQELTSAVSRAATMKAVAEEAVLEVTHDFGAEAGALAISREDDGVIEIAHAVGLTAGEGGRGHRIATDEPSPWMEALQRNTLVALESRAVRRAKYGPAADEDLFGDAEAVAVVPVGSGSRAAAALAVALREPRRWTQDERDLLVQIGRRIGQALERAHLYDAAERARVDSEELRARADQELAERERAEEALRDSEARYRALAARTSRLHALTAALSEAVTVDAVARAVVRHGRIVVGAQSGSVTRVVDGDDGQRRFVPVYADDDSLPLPEAAPAFAAEPGLYSTEVAATRQPTFIGSFADWQRRFWRSAARAADGGYASAAALPLVADGVVRGVLAFHFTAPLNFDDDYRVLLTSVAQHCAQALDRARLYEGEQAARAEAEQANRSKDEFLSTVSHELRTPLNAILGWASMLRSGSLDPDKKGRAMQAICDNAARQARLIDELLDISRIIAGRVSLDLREVDLRATLRGAVEAMMPQAEASGIELSFATELPVLVKADERRLEQVFLNLLSNAVKFTPAGGRIDVAIAVSDASVEVRVTDTGIGIDPAFLPHAFDRFRQADGQTTRTHGGLGLGLSIARYLVDAHGGTIRVHSDGAGTGTTSSVCLPLAGIGAPVASHAGGSRPPHAASAESLPDLHGIRVLIVDDDPDAREMMAAALERCGGAVEAADSARHALEILGRKHVDVLLSDIGMPEEDGYELIRRVRGAQSAQMARMPAAAVTAYAREDQRQLALASGFQMHLAKPLDPAGLAQAVASLVRTHVVM